ncbi:MULTISPECIES: NUDIX domain-containing protein [Paenibacillus]|uniref:NUDIX hydrolase n=2 Tax=Paenibacillus lactis TaxID=228574 RepID=G4H9Q8_9BACL|nr:NUDIX domain-containing protein [Paenibacillus lactis]EHB68593.1 NUDIX hydrolase [Paenibacillus lactis 154]MBP1893377.1 mutator protein MutT [Paenibacillus lactis]HAG01371.1 NUDIX domain-containing protein [Paenibacillus lactis]
MRIIVTGGAIIRDNQGRILLQRRSDYGDWGLPGGGMEAGESIEETMIREVFEETGLKVRRHELYTIYSGSRMKYKYPDGNEVVFVMFIFNAEVDFKWRIASDNKTLIYHDQNQESLQLEFKSIEDIEIEEISTVQRPLFEDLKQQVTTLLRS